MQENQSAYIYAQIKRTATLILANTFILMMFVLAILIPKEPASDPFAVLMWMGFATLAMIGAGVTTSAYWAYIGDGINRKIWKRIDPGNHWEAFELNRGVVFGD